MQKGVHAKFVDMSTSVREAAVELIGRFVLNKPELIHQYYDMIIERILVSSLLLILTLITSGLTQKYIIFTGSIYCQDDMMKIKEILTRRIVQSVSFNIKFSELT